tara:strand:+ start:10826 stop:12277 length:1452 start_codon:yes stop_codon:yes gene_type:complete
VAVPLVKKDRIIVIHKVPLVFAEISSGRINDSSMRTICNEEVSYFTTPNYAFDEKHDVYLFPFLLELDGSPWQQANLFLFTSARDNKKGYGASDAVRMKASWLLEYKIFCETNHIDINDFSGRKPSRPSYRYFNELAREVYAGRLERKALNKKTKVVYDFYKYCSRQPGSNIDIERVDDVISLKKILRGSGGQSYGVTLEERGQSLRSFNKGSPVPVGFVREYGEDLRPLQERERVELMRVLNSRYFSVDERLIYLIGMHTGARKQTILTFRMKHLKEFAPEKRLKDGTYKVNAGPGTSIDTKYDKRQAIYFPHGLADQIRTYAACKKAKLRRDKFLAENENLFDEEDVYLFLSPEGDAHYMAKSDPRYKTTKSRPKGSNTYYTKKKIVRYAEDFFPKGFTFHWTRATYALGYYNWLKPLSAKGLLTDGDIISMVQKRMHHSDRSTTERYLKLFDSIDERVEAQQLYEDKLLELYGIDDRGEA